MLINHRQSAYVDNEELERAAGTLEIRAHGCDDPAAAAVYGAAACALRVLQMHDVRDAKEFATVFDALVFGD